VLGIWRLQLLREIERRGTIRAAAEALCVSPSGVSQQLAMLEQEAGVPLLEKIGRRVRLTDAGMLLVQHADVITGAIAAAEADMAAFRDQVSGQLRVAAIPTAARAVMPGVMVALGRQHPALKVTMQDLDSARALTALRLEEIDIAIVDEYDELSQVRDPVLRTHVFLQDPFFVARPPESAARESLGLAELRDEAWIVDSEGTQALTITLGACRAAGFEPRIRSQCKDYWVIGSLVEAGLGVALMPGLALKDRPFNIAVSRTQPALARRVAAIVRRERRNHPALLAMLSALDRFGETYTPA
jgi:DNA-binding transcriptional LysR family regulator